MEHNVKQWNKNKIKTDKRKTKVNINESHLFTELMVLFKRYKCISMH